MNRVIVTGANGFIGSTLVEKFITKGIDVIAIDISFEKSALPQSERIIKIESDLQNVDELLSMIPPKGYDAFYHLAWAGVNGNFKADPNTQINNIAITMNCVKVASCIKCKKILCSGTIAERSIDSLPYLSTISGGMVYGVAKQCTHLFLETYCKILGIDFVWMQFSNIYGPTNKTGNLVSYTIEQIIKGEVATFGPALQPYDFIYIDDLIEAVVRLGLQETKKNIYFIGSGQPRILKDYLCEIGEQCGKKELIQVGVRPDDGIKYSFDMFDILPLKEEIGDYVSKTFSEGIKYTLERY